MSKLSGCVLALADQLKDPFVVSVKKNASTDPELTHHAAQLASLPGAITQYAMYFFRMQSALTRLLNWSQRI
jgi:hypothetical protein